MLYLDTPIYFINGLQIHRDFQNANQFYFFPGAPRIHRENGEPAFQLLKYARDVTDNPLMPPDTKEQVGGAFLVFTADIGVDEKILEDTKRQIGAFAEGEVVLAPVPFHTGAVRLLALGATSETLGEQPAQPTNLFVEKIFGTTKPSLYGDNLALFGLHLDQEGATLLEDSFRHGGDLLGVVYDLIYAGIRPALQVKAKVDYQRVYDRFEAKIGFQYAMIGAEIGAQLEWLREQGAIEIEITQYDTDPATMNQLRQEAMELIKQEVLAKMFKPSLQVPQSSAGSQGSQMDQVIRIARELSKPPTASSQTTPPPAPARTGEGAVGPSVMNRQTGGQAANQSGGGPGSTPGFALTFSLKYVRKEERKKVDFDFRVNQAVNRNAAPQGSLKLLLEGLNVDNYIREVNLDDPFFRELKARIGVTGDWDALGIQKVVVNATYQPDPAGPIVHTDGWTFNQANEDPKPFNVLLDKNRPVRQYQYKTQIFLKDLPEIDSKMRVLEKLDTTEEREKQINPANEFLPLRVKVEAGPLEWEKVLRVDVKLEYKDQPNAFNADQMFSFTQGQAGPYQWVLYPQDSNLRTYWVTFGYTVKDLAGNITHFDVGPELWSAEGVVVPTPFRSLWPVRVILAVDLENVLDLSADVLFEKGGYRYFETLNFDVEKIATRIVNIPVPDPDPLHDRVQMRWTIVYKDTTVYDVPWKLFEGSTLMLDDGKHWVQPVRVELVISPSEAGLVGVLVKFESLAPDDSVVDTDKKALRGSETICQFELMVNKGTPLRYRYSLTKIKPGNITELVAPIESNETELFVFF